MYFTSDQSVLLVIDVQGKLAMRMHDRKVLFENIKKLIRAAHILEIPIITTEQAPDKIGKTASEIQELLNEASVKKICFSCCQEPEFSQQLSGLKRKQIIVTGIEAHVCVYQTAHDLREQQFDIQVVVDAVSSRSLHDKEAALARIKDNGAMLTSTEMIICELLRSADHPKFKNIMELIK